MGSPRNPRRRGNSEDSNENLRGRLRELQKQLEIEKRYSRSLEKKLSNSSSEEKVTSPSLPKPVCTHCGKEDTIRVSVIWSPAKEIVWHVCEICGHKEKK